MHILLLIMSFSILAQVPEMEKIFPSGECDLLQGDSKCTKQFDAISQKLKTEKKDFELLKRLHLITAKALREIVPANAAPMFYNEDWAKLASDEERKKTKGLDPNGEVNASLRKHPGTIAEDLQTNLNILLCMKKSMTEVSDLDEIYKECKFYGSSVELPLGLSKEQRKKFIKAYIDLSKSFYEYGLNFGFWKRSDAVFSSIMSDNCNDDYRALAIPAETKKFEAILSTLISSNQEPSDSGDKLLAGAAITPEMRRLFDHFRWVVKKYWPMIKSNSSMFPDEKLRLAFEKWNPKTELGPAIDVRTYFSLVDFYKEKYMSYTVRPNDGRFVFAYATGLCNDGEGWDSKSGRNHLKDCFYNSIDEVIQRQKAALRVQLIRNKLSRLHDEAELSEQEVFELIQLDKLIPYVDPVLEPAPKK